MTILLTCGTAGVGEVIPRRNVGGIDRLAGIGLFVAFAEAVGYGWVFVWIHIVSSSYGVALEPELAALTVSWESC